MKIELVDKIKEQIRIAEDKMKMTFAITEPERIEALLEKKEMANPLPRTEHQEQAAVIEWANWNKRKYPELELLFAIPNGGHRHISSAIKLKREGVKAGVPDLCLAVPRGASGCLWIEMKTLKGKTTLPQQRFLKLLNQHGHLAVVCFTADEAIAFIKQYLELETCQNSLKANIKC